jgi:hypothetical protein
MMQQPPARAEGQAQACDAQAGTAVLCLDGTVTARNRAMAEPDQDPRAAGAPGRPRPPAGLEENLAIGLSLGFLGLALLLRLA